MFCVSSICSFYTVIVIFEYFLDIKFKEIGHLANTYTCIDHTYQLDYICVYGMSFMSYLACSQI